MRSAIHDTSVSYISDFKTGLKYKFDYLTDQCEVTKLTNKFRDENVFFDFRNVDYQYSGKVIFFKVIKLLNFIAIKN